MNGVRRKKSSAARIAQRARPASAMSIRTYGSGSTGSFNVKPVSLMGVEISCWKPDCR